MPALDAMTARRLARSILEARKEGRTLRPLTNIHLLTRADALNIQDALLDLRLGQGELLIGWYLDNSYESAPLTDRMIFQTQPIGLVDPTRVGAVALSADSANTVDLIIDRVVKGGLVEDYLAHGCGLAGIILGGPIEYEIDDSRQEAKKVLGQRGRVLLDTEMIIRPVR